MAKKKSSRGRKTKKSQAPQHELPSGFWSQVAAVGLIAFALLLVVSWFGGGGDVNRSTGDSMGEPTFKAFSMRQRFLKHMLESVGRYVIRQKLIAEAGEPDWWDERLACEAVFPEMTARDTT